MTAARVVSTFVCVFAGPGRIHDEQILLGGDSFCLEPGRYTFRLSLHDDESSVFRFMVWPAHPGQNCS